MEYKLTEMNQNQIMLDHFNQMLEAKQEQIFLDPSIPLFRELCEINQKNRQSLSPNLLTMEDTVKQLRSAFKDLFHDTYYHDLSPILKRFPDAATNCFIFEIRLNEKNSRADFSIRLTNETHVKKILTETAPNNPISEFAYDNPIWRNIRAFWNEWAKRDSTYKINNMWLEFDMDQRIGEIPIPSVFFSTNNRFYEPWMTEDALAKLMDSESLKQAKAKLILCFHHLPQNAKIAQFGVMFSRNTDKIRLYIRGINPNEIVNYLAAIGYNVNIAERIPLIEKLAQAVEVITLQIDVGTNISPKIGIEYNLNDLLQRPKTVTLIDSLVAKKLCSVENRELITHWPKIFAAPNPNSSLPIIILKVLSHLKIALEPGKDMEAKAYLGVEYY